jgi:hypothetical protein
MDANTHRYEKAYIYNKPPHILVGRLGQRPDGTIITRGDQTDGYDQQPGLCSTLFQRPDWTMISADNKMDFYSGKPNLFFGRASQAPYMTIEWTGYGVDFYYKRASVLFGRAFQRPDQSIVTVESSYSRAVTAL